MRSSRIRDKRRTRETHGERVTDFDGLAIARYDDGLGYQLFYCDENWVTINDGYGDSIEEVLRQVEFEFGAVTFRDVR